ncbi:hypothetical protein LCGC14_1397810 [marine sediment metagenome]|uniref:Uncharacterized protein n=1 Tax=marine sediment metagenome TaxID=412755 RepID=A0A0F9KIX0_9ZZZZ
MKRAKDSTVRLELIVYFRHPNERWLYGVLVMTSPDNIGWSACSRQDQFCRRVGRDIARRRAATGVYRLPKEYNGLHSNRNPMLIPMRSIIKHYQREADTLWSKFIHREL